MNTFEGFGSQLYDVNDKSLEELALRVFRHQASHNPVYKSFIQHLGVVPHKIHSLQSIPCLPVSFFKGHNLQTGSWQPQAIFRSSGTTGSTPSVHPVKDLQFYLDHSLRCFEHFFGLVSGYNFMALLPTYLERSDSSLVVMIDHFIKQSGSSFSGFYLHDIGKLLEDLKKARKSPKKTILWGVTYALLDLAKHSPDLDHCLVFETGGMKGTRDELTRRELHATLRTAFNVDAIYSEYGMTELMSQCYTRGNEHFHCPPGVQIMIRDLSDPFEKGLLDATGGINIVDLANWHSISFIETEDLGKAYPDGGFEVLGRADNSDVRGCNLMVNG